MLSGKKFKKIAAALTAGAFSLSVLAASPAVAEAGILGNIIGAAGAAVSGTAMKKQAKQQIEYYNTTEEGRQELFAAFKEKYGVNENVYLNNRVNVLMKNLTKAVGTVDSTIYDKPYLYFVNNQETINAFCANGHVMSINAGLLNQFPNDDEVAVVVGHEMGHGQKDHPAKGVIEQIDKAMWTQIAVSASGAGTAGSVVGNLLLKQSNAHGTKKEEKEADNLAFLYVTHSNYNPGACAAVWQRFLDTQGDNSQNAIGSIFAPSDHPNNAARRDTYVKLLEEYSKGKVTAKDGAVFVNGKELVRTAASDGMSGAERSYFIFGNLAAAYHNNHNTGKATVQNNTVMLGAQPIIKPVNGEGTAAEIAARLNEIK